MNESVISNSGARALRPYPIQEPVDDSHRNSVGERCALRQEP
jgi:hypothetical protein